MNEEEPYLTGGADLAWDKQQPQRQLEWGGDAWLEASDEGKQGGAKKKSVESSILRWHSADERRPKPRLEVDCDDKSENGGFRKVSPRPAHLKEALVGLVRKVQQLGSPRGSRQGTRKSGLSSFSLTRRKAKSETGDMDDDEERDAFFFDEEDFDVDEYVRQMSRANPVSSTAE